MLNLLATLLIAAMLNGPTASASDNVVSVVDRPPADASNTVYPGNRPPLLPSPFVKLPVGAIRPEGWLREQLTLQADGFHGHLTEISRFLEKQGNSWLDPQGQGSHGWEEVPYWLKGFGDCAYLLGREDQIDEAKLWIEGALDSQRPDGYFGPRGQGAKATVGSTDGKYDLWPNMVMLNCLQSYHGFNGDDRVLDFMSNYFRWELALPDEEFLPPYWQHQRGADNLSSVYWLYNRTGEPFLLELAAKIHRNTARWDEGIANWHNVNIAEAFDGGTLFYPQSKDPNDLVSADRNYGEIRRLYGQVPGGMFGSDENCRAGFDDPRQAVETCGMVEMMYSAEQLLAVTGDPVWADRCEDVAFNSLPAALTSDLKALRYLTAPNMAVSDRRDHAPGIQNGGPMFCMDPHDHRCCQHNFGHGWPYLAEHLWLATADDGLALAFPLSGAATAKVGEGVEVTVRTDSDYPFDDQVSVTLSTERAVAFPLYFRIPGWCEGATLAINGAEVEVQSKPMHYLRIDRTWNDGDTVDLRLPMRVTLRTWEENHDSVSVDRGPLTYSLLIGEERVRSGGTDAWPAWEIRPTSPWNYGLVLDGRDPTATFEVVRRDWPKSGTPWTPESTPILLRAEGKRIPQWQLDPFGLVATLQESPAASDMPTEAITLIPMGSARLRIASFPVIGAGPDATRWEGQPEPLPYQVEASHCYESDTPDAVKDRIEPNGSADREIPRFTWWPRRGSTEWIEYTFDAPRELSGVSIYWFDDTPEGGCALPLSCRVLVQRAGQWTEAAASGGGEIAGDRFQAIRFEPATAEAVRLEVTLRPGRSAGILEWRVDGPDGR